MFKKEKEYIGRSKENLGLIGEFSSLLPLYLAFVFEKADHS